MTHELETLKAAWRQSPPLATPPLQAAQLRALVAARYQRERRLIGRYVWGAAFWQALVYSSLASLAWHFRLEPTTLAACGLGVLLYLPFTVVFGQKFRGYARRRRQTSQGPSPTLAAQVAQQQQLLSQFFRFKKRFDVLATPVTALVMVALFTQLGWVPAVTKAPGPGAFLGGLIVGVFALALRWENQHQFAEPLRRLQALQQDLATP